MVLLRNVLISQQSHTFVHPIRVRANDAGEYVNIKDKNQERDLKSNRLSGKANDDSGTHDCPSGKKRVGT